MKAGEVLSIPPDGHRVGLPREGNQRRDGGKVSQASVEYAKDLYQTEYPRPSALLAEASRIAMPDAPIGFLHFLVPLPPAAARIESVYGVTTGPNYRIRAFTILRKNQQDLGSRSRSLW